MTIPPKLAGISGHLSLLDRVPTASAASSAQTPLQVKVDQGVSDFVHYATDWKAIAAITAGGTAYRSGRVAMMGRGIGSVRQAVDRGISVLAGLSAEVSTFEFTHRALQNDSNLWRWNGPGGLRQGLLNSFITFGTLKGAGRLAHDQNLIARHLLQDTGMVLGHQVSGALGVTPRPTETLAEQFLHAEATNLQVGAGMAVAHRFAPGIHALERGLDLPFQAGKGGDRKSQPLPVGSSLAFAVAEGRPAPDFPKKSNILLMKGKGSRSEVPTEDLLASAPPSVKKLAEKFSGDEKVSPELLLMWVVEYLLNKGRMALLPEEKKFLLEVADRQIDVYRRKEDRYRRARGIYWALHDFSGLRRMARVLEDDNYDKWEAHMFLEDHEEAFRLFDLAVKNLYKGMPQENRIFYGIQEEIYAYVEDFAARRGYENCGVYPTDKAVSALSRLSHSYDLIIAIAKGGLFSGAMAEFLDLPVKLIEIHAHDREIPTSKFVDEIRPEEIAGKRILFVDKDTITGASIREAVKLFAPYRPAGVGAFFNFEVGHIIPESTVKDLRAQGIAMHFPNDVEPVPTLPLFYKIHERLNTPLGRFRKALRGLEEIIPSVQNANPEAEGEIRDYIERQKRVFFAFNPWLPGVDRIRSLMLSRIETLLKNFSESRTLGQGYALNHLLGLMRIDTQLPMGYAGELAYGRYHEKGLKLAKARGVENIHSPHSYTASFRTAQKVVKEKYDVALIVGPEGFAYEPIFQDLGLKTLAVNIPEADFGRKRSIAVFDDLSKLTGKRVLVVEDDVRSGATLQKLLEEIRLYNPGFLGLYLGLPAIRQMAQNIPPDFKKVYVTEDHGERDEAVFLNHLKKREVIFKEKRPPLAKKR